MSVIFIVPVSCKKECSPYTHRWTGANSFRTSHYPYAEEVMDIADKNGIVLVNEAPAVSLGHGNSGFNSKLLHNHIMGKILSSH